jgi:hypothetical protein
MGADARGVGVVVRNFVGNTTTLFLGKNCLVQRIIIMEIVVAVIRYLVRRPFVEVGVRHIVVKDGNQAI